MHREAGSVLAEAKEKMQTGGEGRATIDGLVALVPDVREALTSGRIHRIGRLLDASWIRAGLRELPIGFELEGSRIIHYSV